MNHPAIGYIIAMHKTAGVHMDYRHAPSYLAIGK
jgi:hypothetical protein